MSLSVVEGPSVSGRLPLGAVPIIPLLRLMNALIADAREFVSGGGSVPVPRATCVVYCLRLRSGALYIGASQDPEQRMADHASGRGGRTTRLDPPAALVRLATASHNLTNCVRISSKVTRSLENVSS